MSGSLNRVELIGNLCADPESRSFANGGKVCNLRIATSERWKNKNGERQERTEFHNVAIFSDGLISVAERFLRKGSKIYLAGQLRTRKWQDQSGNDRYATEVVLQGPGSSIVMLDKSDTQSGNNNTRNGGHQVERCGAKGGYYDDFDDDIDF